jgi:hypothetical protein
MEDLMALVGLVLLLEGLPYFLSPGGMKRMTREILKASDRVLRLSGMAAMVAGLLLVYLGRR